MSEISFDPATNERNIASRGISFQVAEQFEWDTALVVEDLRQTYGERRFQALGIIAARLHAMVFTPRFGKVHVISLRKASRREVKQYEAKGWSDETDARESRVDQGHFRTGATCSS